MSLRSAVLTVDGEYHLAEHVAADDAHGTETGESGVLFEQQGGNVGEGYLAVGCGDVRHGHPCERDCLVVGINGCERVDGRPAEAVGKRFQKRGLPAGIENEGVCRPIDDHFRHQLAGNEPVRHRRGDGLRLRHQTAEA